MSPRTQEVFDAALGLTEVERAELAEQLLESIDPEFDPMTEEEWAAEIKRRVDEMDSGEVEGIPWEEVRAKLQRAQDEQAD